MTISKGVYQDNGNDCAQAKIPVKFRGFVLKNKTKTSKQLNITASQSNQQIYSE